jgi:hypothetical protein
VKNVVVRTTSIDFDLSSDFNTRLPMPAGTSITATTKDNTTNNLACTISRVLPSTVLNVSPGTSATADRSTPHSVQLDKCAAGDRVFVTVKSPSGLETIFTFDL